MSDRTSFRSRPAQSGPSSSSRGHSSRGNHRGGGGSSNRGGGAHHQHQSSSSAPGATTDRPKKENILDLAKYMDKRICVKFNHGREVTGTLKGHDLLTNLVLDDTRETLHGTDPETGAAVTSSRELGLVVARGTLLVMISPVDGSEEIANPFGGGVAEEEEQEVLGGPEGGE